MYTNIKEYFIIYNLIINELRNKRKCGCSNRISTCWTRWLNDKFLKRSPRQGKFVNRSSFFTLKSSWLFPRAMKWSKLIRQLSRKTFLLPKDWNVSKQPSLIKTCKRRITRCLCHRFMLQNMMRIMPLAKATRALSALSDQVLTLPTGSKVRLALASSICRIRMTGRDWTYPGI